MEDKNKVAKTIADMLGVDSSKSPEQAINNGLKSMKDKPVPKELYATLKKMLALATEVGIHFDKSLASKALKEGAIEVDGIAPLSTAEPATMPKVRFKEYMKKKSAHHMDNHEEDPHTTVGDSLEDKKIPDDDQLRRRKVDYAMSEEVEIEDNFELSDEELEDMAADVDDEDDILDVYDDDELAIIDTETGEEEVADDSEDPIDESVLNEVLSKGERMRAKIRFLKFKSKRQRKLKLALKKRSDTKTLTKRARHLAIRLMKIRIMKKDPSLMSVSEKERVEQIITRRKKSVDRLAMKLLPRIRRIENERLTHKKAEK